MKRILLLCFIHGFKGDDDTFRGFPRHLEDAVTANLPDHLVTSVVYPKYETRGELDASTAAFLAWLREQVVSLRRQHLDAPWPPNDRSVGVILVAHSMGGFVASDCLFQILDERRRDKQDKDDTASDAGAGGDSGGPIFPLIQGILAFDTPYNGLARSMFVYGAFSNYQKVSNVFNVMTALSAAAPATLSRLATKRAAGSAAGSAAASSRRASPAWKTWQLIAVRTGAVGAIAAGDVAAYMHRKQILEGVRGVRGLTREDVVQGYQQSVDALGQGLAYVNKGNVGASFAWLSDHFTFVGALLRQNELNRRLERLASLRGIGIRDYYASLGENGYWSGGYFVPERTFCAVPPDKDHPAAHLFRRHVVEGASDEIAAHVNLFKEDKNPTYREMLDEAARLVVGWFEDDAEIYDDPRFAGPPPPEPAETERIAKAVDNAGATGEIAADTDAAEKEDENIPDESPIDIAAAASLVPLPDDDSDRDGDEGGGAGGDKKAGEQKKAYLRHLFGVAQSTGTNLWSSFPLSKLSGVEVSRVSVSIPSMPSVSMPRGLFSKRERADGSVSAGAAVSDGGKEERDKEKGGEHEDGATDGQPAHPTPEGVTGGGGDAVKS